jgi:hypothetical protein
MKHELLFLNFAKLDNGKITIFYSKSCTSIKGVIVIKVYIGLVKQNYKIFLMSTYS